MHPKKKNARRLSREMALQTLYQNLLSRAAIEEIQHDVFDLFPPKSRVDRDYFNTLINGVLKYQETIDQALIPELDRPFKQLSPIESIVLRMGSFEILYQPDIPYRVIINESIEVAKHFGAEDAYKYINGVLDRLAHKARSNEVHRIRSRVPLTSTE